MSRLLRPLLACLSSGALLLASALLVDPGKHWLLQAMIRPKLVNFLAFGSHFQNSAIARIGDQPRILRRALYISGTLQTHVLRRF